MTEPQRIGGRYEVGELLGRGGMAEVRKGTDVRLGRTVAIKRLRTDLASDATFQARFRREAQSAASLNHPSIVSVYDTGEEMSTDGSNVAQPYIVMEYVAGRTLRDILREGRKILPERALEITSGVLAALDYSHRAGIIHRDIKPGNVMLTPSGDVKVMDFGIARAVSDASSTMTQTAAVVGTAQYLSPEQARGENVDSRSDVYSTGCLLYELLTGRPPFVGDSPVSVAYQHVREQAQPPSSLDEDLTPELDAIVMKSLAKNVGDRYPSAAAMKADIDRYLAGKPVQAPAVAAAPPTSFIPPDTSTQGQPVTDPDDEPERKRRGPLILLHPGPGGPDRRRAGLRTQAVQGGARADVGADAHRSHPRPGRAHPQRRRPRGGRGDHRGEQGGGRGTGHLPGSPGRRRRRSRRLRRLRRLQRQARGGPDRRGRPEQGRRRGPAARRRAAGRAHRARRRRAEGPGRRDAAAGRHRGLRRLEGDPVLVRRAGGGAQRGRQDRGRGDQPDRGRRVQGQPGHRLRESGEEGHRAPAEPERRSDPRQGQHGDDRGLDLRGTDGTPVTDHATDARRRRPSA